MFTIFLFRETLPFTILGLDSAANYLEVIIFSIVFILLKSSFEIGDHPFEIFYCNIQPRLQFFHESGLGTPHHADSTAHQLFKLCPAWQERRLKIMQAARNQNRGALNTMNRKMFADLNPDIPNIVLFDGVDEDSQGINGLTTEPLAQLQSLILGYFHAQMPCIAFGSLRRSTNDQWKEAATLVEAGIPVLYIDIRNRTQQDYNQSLGSIWERVNGENLAYLETLLRSGRLDVLNTCRLSYFHSVFTRARLGEDQGTRSRSNTGRISIFSAIKMLQSESREEHCCLSRLSSQVQISSKITFFR
jgi:hypothetical protein